MKLDIFDEPIRFQLHGIADRVENERYAEVGMRLMNEMWPLVSGAGLANTGINHWVYLDEGRMFVGVELLEPGKTPIPARLQSLEFELQRYLRHLHVGPYQLLPQKWKDLKAELAARAETMTCPSLEVYGHHGEEPSKLETTILIGLRKKAA